MCHYIALISVAVLQIVSAVVFLFGFVPSFFHTTFDIQNSSRPFSIQNVKGISSSFEELSDIYEQLVVTPCDRTSTRPSPPPYSRLVFIVVDALRHDFVFGRLGENWKFVRGEIEQGRTVATVAHAQAPTVTLPRIKALMSGTAPSFVDALQNFDSANAFMGYSVIDGLASVNLSRIAFYGDDTWLRLFGDKFLQRSEGVTSFFVSDYTEVDSNVTRHIAPELANLDSWDVLILHYLGLDHIGHLFGPRSHLLPNKLQEMDGIVAEVMDALNGNHRSKRDSLVVLVGDHGMTEQGSHGGSTQSETDVPLLFLNTHSRNKLHLTATASDSRERIPQVDLVPTLAALFSFPMPTRSLGVTIDAVLLHNGFSDSQRLLLTMENTVQLLMAHHQGNFGTSDEFMQVVVATALRHISWCQDEGDFNYEDIRSSYKLVARRLQKRMLTAVTSYVEGYMVLGLSFSLTASVCAMVQLVMRMRAVDPYSPPESVWRLANYSLLTIVASLLHGLSFLSSSFIEEEHYFWYLTLPTVWTLLLYNYLYDSAWEKGRSGKKYRRFVMYGVAVLMTIRLIRSFNTVGIKWADLSGSLGEFIDRSEFVHLLHTGALVSLICLLLVGLKRVAETTDYDPVSVIAAVCAAMSVFCYHCSSGTLGMVVIILPGYLAARLAYAAVLLLISLSCFRGKCSEVRRVSGVLLALTWLVILFCKTKDFVLLALLVCAETFAVRAVCLTYNELTFNFCSCINPLGIQMFYYYMAGFGYFAMGNSNSFGTLDVAAGYVGVNDFYQWFAFTMMVVRAYSAPIIVWATFFYRCSTKWHVFGLGSVSTQFYQLLSVLVMVPFSCSLCATYLMRYHLFVWSVFAPKVFYECVHCIILSVIIITANLIPIFFAI